MYSVKKKKPKDHFIQNTYVAIEDYLRDSDQKDNNINNYLIYSSNKQINYRPTNIKLVSMIPILENGIFIDTIKQYIQSENLHINNSNIFDEVERSQNGHQIIIEKYQKNENEKDDISQNMEKFEILEDGSICKKNTTGMISPSIGEKYLEIKNSNCEDTNKDIDTDILVNSKLLISNNIKSLEIENKKEDDFNEQSKKNNNIFENKEDNWNNYTKDKNSTNLIDNSKNNDDNNFPYFSTSKKNQFIQKNMKQNLYNRENNLNKINRKKINTNIVKKRLIKTEVKNSKNYNIFNDSANKKTYENKNKCFIKEIAINNNINNNELNYKRILFRDNFIENDDIINQWKYLSNKYIKNYNKKLLSTNIQIITQNLKIEKILEEKNKSKKNFNKNDNFIEGQENYFDLIKEEYNNMYIQDNIAQSININEYNNKNDSESEFIFKPTDISYILKPPIINFNNTYENVFEEIDILSEQNIKNTNNKIKKYQCDIESINEEMNESSEEQESNEEKVKEINIATKIYYNKNEKRKEISKIHPPLIDKFRIDFDIRKISQLFKNIEMSFKKLKEVEINEIVLLSHSNTEIPKMKEFINEEDNISKETETEISDEEIIIDKNGKIIDNNDNLLIHKFLTYEIEKNEKENKIKLVFIKNNLSNKIKTKRYLINIKSYKKIIKMIFYKKRKPISKNSYESLIEIMIKNFYIFKKEIILKKDNKKYTQQEREKMNNLMIKVNNKIKEFEETIKELKYLYIYGLIKKPLIKDKYEKKKFLKSLNISKKRNKIKILYKELINILNNKINNGENSANFYQYMIDILKKYEKINDEDINIEKMNKIIEYNNKKNKIKNNNNKQKILFILIPLMYIINYFANNFNLYEYNEIN